MRCCGRVAFLVESRGADWAVDSGLVGPYPLLVEDTLISRCRSGASRIPLAGEVDTVVSTRE